ncbi:fructose-bisphosphate aldolase [Pseudomonas sp. CCM 7893]|uniref:Fructose-bisphosphate aldolase n=1 Tax=Pseudomonas spelaei TaxID=1055469 RepID=A0A6I3WK94_9PSED|nr:fructose-bisphosphate aldolase [Pseudomonas spelaei]MUF07739.1 fructose-bisphosphate aldolase [Pseudomonas spelaei]
MTLDTSPDRYTPLTRIATDTPVLLIDNQAPLLDLHACVSERLRAALGLITTLACTTLNDTDERDLNTLANVARVLLQDASDVFAVIERRAF